MFQATTVQLGSGIVSIVPLKKLAETTLKDGSSLKSLIMSEPDQLSREEYIVKAKVYARLLEQELRSK